MPQVAKKFKKVKKSRFWSFLLILQISIYPKKVLMGPFGSQNWLPEVSRELEIIRKQLSWTWRHILIPRSFSGVAQNHFWASFEPADIYVSMLLGVYRLLTYMSAASKVPREASEHHMSTYEPPKSFYVSPGIIIWRFWVMKVDTKCHRWQKSSKKSKKVDFSGTFSILTTPKKVNVQPLETKIWQSELCNEPEIVLKQLSWMWRLILIPKSSPGTT